MRDRIELVMSMVVLICAFLLARTSASHVMSEKVKEEMPCIVVDAGHGGFDSGKVGVNGELEKDINLQIALKLKTVLEQENFRVVLTRDSDQGLYEEKAKNKKVQDLQNRCNMINESQPILAVSIHQNSYTSPEISGAQVFYYSDSLEGKKLAEILQQSLIEQMDPQNHRAAKENNTYYLLKNTKPPIVIVECGFLSNPVEASKLTNEGYQLKLAETIKNGILKYLQ